MKRGSLVGPVLIILVGVWFLLGTLRPDLPMLDAAARFWPFLLIAWGLARLFEIFSMAAKRRALPVSGISGGEWTLVVFICLIGSTLYIANRHQPWQRIPFVRINKIEMFGHGYDFPIAEQRVPAGKAARLLVENFKGNTRIVGADVPEIMVAGRKSVRALDEKDAAVADQQTQLEVNAQSDQVVIRTNQDRLTGEQRVSADLDITVPRSIALEIRGRSGDLEITGISGGVEVSSDSADIRLQQLGGNVRLDVRKADVIRAIDVKGNIEVIGGRGRDAEFENIGGEVTLNGSFSGDLQFRSLARALRIQTPQTDFRVEKVPGNLHMDLGDVVGTNLVGPIRLSTNRSRDVHLEQFTEGLELSVERGDITLRPAQKQVPRITVKTGMGEIDLAIPENGMFELKAEADRGEIVNDFGPALKLETEGEGRGGRLVGKTGVGPSIVLNSGRGGITVRKDTGEALADKPSPRDNESERQRPRRRGPGREPLRPERI